MQFEQPDFLAGGTFAWDGLGYRFATPPPIDLLDPAALRSDNPWIVLASVLQRAKAGDFGPLPALMERMRMSDSWVLSRDCALLLGDAGSASVLRQVAKELDSAGDVDTPYSFSASGLLWTVPHMLEIYSRNPSHDSIVPVLISKLLEKGYGPVALGRPPGSEYRAMVMQQYDELRGQLGSDAVPVLYGELFSVRKVALHLLEFLKADEIQKMMVRHLRHRFEASTGIDCSAFFQEHRLQLLAARAIVEDFLEGPNAGVYQEGVRYFFGHRIPD